MGVVEIKLKVKGVSKRRLSIIDENLSVAFKIVKVRKRVREEVKEGREGGKAEGTGEEFRYVVYLVRPPKNVFKKKLPRLERDLILEFIKEVGSKGNDEFLLNCAEVLTDELMRIISQWGDLAEVKDLVEDLRRSAEISSTPSILTLRSENGVIEVIKSDGLKVPLYGGFISLGNKYAVLETTYAFARVRKEVRDGVVEAVDVVPVVFVAEFEDGRLINRKVLYPDKSIEVFGRPVRVEVRSKAKTTLSTLMDVETGRKFLNGGVSKQFDELFNIVRNVVKQYVDMYS
jgi:hypothetical protein